jgi:GNAT superfamily N-acetyltransferase
MIEIREFRRSDIDDAASLFAESFSQARIVLPLIPPHPDADSYAAQQLERIADHAGFAAFDGGRLIGYMVERFTSDSFMGEPTGFSIGLFPFAVSADSGARVCQLLYKRLSRAWIERGYHAHNLSYFATDEPLSSVFFRLGFGMTHFELFRDLELPRGEVPDVEIRYIEDEAQISEIDDEHHRYYPNPPLFWIPHDCFDRDAARSGAKQELINHGRMEIVAAFVESRTAAYFCLTKGTSETEFFTDPGTGQIKGAYAHPEFRGRGIGKALLAETVKWAKRNGLARLYVEGESANIYGGQFWWKHFTPAEYFVRRCVDRRVSVEMFTEP